MAASSADGADGSAEPAGGEAGGTRWASASPCSTSWRARPCSTASACANRSRKRSTRRPGPASARPLPPAGPSPPSSASASPADRPPVPAPTCSTSRPTEDQQLIRDTVAEFATEQLRERAAEADATCATPDDLIAKSAELGITLLGVPEELGGVGHRTLRAHLDPGHRSPRQGRHGPCRRLPRLLGGQHRAGAVGPQRHPGHLPARVRRRRRARRRAGHHRTARPVRPVRPAHHRPPHRGGFVIDGVKSMVARAAQAELFVDRGRTRRAGAGSVRRRVRAPRAVRRS